MDIKNPPRGGGLQVAVVAAALEQMSGHDFEALLGLYCHEAGVEVPGEVTYPVGPEKPSGTPRELWDRLEPGKRMLLLMTLDRMIPTVPGMSLRIVTKGGSS